MSVPDNYLEVTPEQLVRFRELQTPEERDHDDGYDAGGPLDLSKSQAYQFGQAARRESDEAEQ